jgi:cytochrome c-type biogenesis protein CcmH/NrfG
MLAELARDEAQDPRTWTTLGRHLLDTGLTEDGDAAKTRVVKAYVQAHRLAPDSAPYALNAATLCRWAGGTEWEQREAEFLQRTLDAGALAGADELEGSHACPFWIRWQRALAEKQATLAMLRAEAHIRLAVIMARYGELGLAEHQLSEARELDPANWNGARLLAEMQWNTGRPEDAIETLRGYLPNSPFDLAARGRLVEMLEAAGLDAEAEYLSDESARIAEACGKNWPGPVS